MYAPVDKPAFWDEKYKMNRQNWDMKSANPVFAELINNSFLKPCKILIVGSGKGYDAVLAAQKVTTLLPWIFLLLLQNTLKSLPHKTQLILIFLMKIYLL